MKRILSFTLALILTMSALALTAFAADEAISVTNFAELQAAVANANDGDVIKVTADLAITAPLTFTKNVTIAADSAVTIVANGAVDAFTATAGTLILGENLTINSNTSILYANGGNIVVDGAVINAANANYNLAFADSGCIEIKSGSLNQSGNDKVTVDATGSNASVIVSGGTIYSENSSAVCVRNGATLTIASGFVKTDVVEPNRFAAYSWNSGKIAMTGGEVSAANDNGLGAAADGIIEVSGGTVDGITATGAGAEITITGGVVTDAVKAEATSATITITGGTFDADVSEFLADGYTTIDGEVKKDRGTLLGGLVNLGGYITTEIDGLNAEESVAINLYSGETLIATTTWAKDFPIAEAKGEITSVKICFNTTSSSWETEWKKGKLSADYIPDSATLVVDGEEYNTVEIEMIAASTEEPVVWADVIPANAITVAQEGEGTVVLSKEKACAGEKIEVSLTPAAGYNLGYVEILDGDGEPVVLENNKFEMPASEVTVNVYFTEAPVYDVSVSVLGNGRVTTSQDSYYEGAIVRLNVTHKVGYVLSSITVTDIYGNDVPVDGTSFEMPGCEVDVCVVFKKVLPKPATMNFKAYVELEGAELEAGSFKFQLSYVYRGTEYVIETIENPEDGKIEFAPNLVYAPHSYTFFIKQIALDDAGIEYDMTVYEISAVVDYSKGYLSATLSQNDVVFVNYAK